MLTCPSLRRGRHFFYLNVLFDRLHSPLLSAQTKLAGEAQSKYERELMLHAADVEALQELKKRSQQEAAQRRELEEQLAKMSSLLHEKTTTWNTLERQLNVGQTQH